MNLAQAEALADLILEHVPEDRLGDLRYNHHGRKRIESDLAGLRYCLEGGLHGQHSYLTTLFSANLLRSARLYGVRVPEGVEP